MNTILQIPINKALRNKAAKAAGEMGFSSLQEIVRLFINKVATGNVDFTFQETIKLSPQAVKRYNKIINEIDSGQTKIKSFSTAKSLLDHLNGN